MIEDLETMETTGNFKKFQCTTTTTIFWSVEEVKKVVCQDNMNSLCIIKSFQPIDLKFFILPVMQQGLKYANFVKS